MIENPLYSAMIRTSSEWTAPEDGVYHIEFVGGGSDYKSAAITRINPSNTLSIKVGAADKNTKHYKLDGGKTSVDNVNGRYITTDGGYDNSDNGYVHITRIS
jgi:hypothetical protein